jgi:hypothetical protein
MSLMSARMMIYLRSDHLLNCDIKYTDPENYFCLAEIKSYIDDSFCRVYD